MYLAARRGRRVDVEVCISDSGVGMSEKKLDLMFRELEQVEAVGDNPFESISAKDKIVEDKAKTDEDRILGLGLAAVARVLRNMDGQLRLKSEEGKGTRFILRFPFELPEEEPWQEKIETESVTSVTASATPQGGKPSPTLNPPSPTGERTPIGRGYTGEHLSQGGSVAISRKNSMESFGSKSSLRSQESVRSAVSMGSVNSAKSEADRLIEAIQAPHQAGG